MTTNEFNKIINTQLELCKKILIDKSIEYNQDEDERLDCFIAGAKLSGKSLKEVLGGMMIKHTISIYQMINSKKEYKLDKWTEKITDHINYLLILKSIIIEENNNKDKNTNKFEEEIK